MKKEKIEEHVDKDKRSLLVFIFQFKKEGGKIYQHTVAYVAPPFPT